MFKNFITKLIIIFNIFFFNINYTSRLIKFQLDQVQSYSKREKQIMEKINNFSDFDNGVEYLNMIFFKLDNNGEYLIYDKLRNRWFILLFNTLDDKLSINIDGINSIYILNIFKKKFEFSLNLEELYIIFNLKYLLLQQDPKLEIMFLSDNELSLIPIIKINSNKIKKEFHQSIKEKKFLSIKYNKEDYMNYINNLIFLQKKYENIEIKIEEYGYYKHCEDWNIFNVRELIFRYIYNLEHRKKESATYSSIICHLLGNIKNSNFIIFYKMIFFDYIWDNQRKLSKEFSDDFNNQLNKIKESFFEIENTRLMLSNIKYKYNENLKSINLSIILTLYTKIIDDVIEINGIFEDDNNILCFLLQYGKFLLGDDIETQLCLQKFIQSIMNKDYVYYHKDEETIGYIFNNKFFNINLSYDDILETKRKFPYPTAIEFQSKHFYNNKSNNQNNLNIFLIMDKNYFKKNYKDISPIKIPH